jgi:hypothetical protein
VRLILLQRCTDREVVSIKPRHLRLNFGKTAGLHLNRKISQVYGRFVAMCTNQAFLAG